MALGRLKTWIAEILTYSDLNSEFNNILNNANALISPFTANVAAGGFKLTGLGAGSALADSATLQQVQYNFGAFLTSVAGTNTITGTATPTPAYTIGQLFTFVPAATNTGAVTLNISSVGAGAVQLAGAALIGGELVINSPVIVYVSAATPVFEIIASGDRRGTFTATLTGVDASVTGTAAYSVSNHVATVFYPPLTGTSNTTACTITGAPSAIQPTTAHSGLVGITQDNGAAAAFARIDVGTNGVVTLYVSATSATFTAANAKGINAGLTITYNLN